MRYRLSTKASAAYDNIILYTIENFGEAQARKYAAGLETSFQLLLDNPRLGVAWNADDKRRYTYRSHYVFYRVLKEEILITQIKNVRQKAD